MVADPGAGVPILALTWAYAAADVTVPGGSGSGEGSWPR
jgi:hypothetical protein